MLCGADQHQEWLLSWWWERYRAENEYPVTFVDYGMTPHAHQWCAERGEIISLNFDTRLIKSKEEIDPHFVHLWGSREEMWIARRSWFQKPFALLQSPYQRCVWMDLDCEVLKPIDFLFSQWDKKSQLALVRDYSTEHLPKLHPDIIYNGGVIVFEYGSSIIQEWAHLCMTQNHRFSGDDAVLSQLIYEKRLEVVELPEIYNWRIVRGIDMNVVIWHWLGKKNFIKDFGGIKPALEGLLR